MEETISNWNIKQGINFKNVQTAYGAEYQKKKKTWSKNESKI